VLAAWQAEARRKAAEAAAKATADKAREGLELGALAKDNNGVLATTAPFTRTGAGAPGLPPELVASLFAAKVGDIVTAPTPQGAYVAKLVSITPADPDKDAEGMKQLQEQLSGTVDGDLLNAFTEELRERYGVEINEHAIESLVGS